MSCSASINDVCACCGHRSYWHWHDSGQGGCDHCDCHGFVLAAKTDEIPPPAPDDIRNPLHYTAHPSGVECIDIIETFPHNRAAAMGYIWRAGLKLYPTLNSDESACKDMRKAIWHLEREIARLTRNI